MISPTEHAGQFVVYVSYCGSDSDFSEDLIRGLTADGRFRVTFDPDTSINEKAWKARIGALIEEADAVVVVLSPDSIMSCEWEVDCATACSKHIVPVLCMALRDARMPAQLSNFTPVTFNSNIPFSHSLDALMSMLKTNADWLHEHTRLLVQAREWEDAGYPYHLLLNRDQVIASKIWTLSRPDDAPKPTDLHITYVCVSEAVDTTRQLVQAEREEAEVVAMLDAANSGGILQRTNKPLLALGCVVLFLTLASSSSYLVAKCTDANLTGSSFCSLLMTDR